MAHRPYRQVGCNLDRASLVTLRSYSLDSSMVNDSSLARVIVEPEFCQAEGNSDFHFQHLCDDLIDVKHNLLEDRCWPSSLTKVLDSVYHTRSCFQVLHSGKLLAFLTKTICLGSRQLKGSLALGSVQDAVSSTRNFCTYVLHWRSILLPLGQ